MFSTWKKDENIREETARLFKVPNPDGTTGIKKVNLVMQPVGTLGTSDRPHQKDPQTCPRPCTNRHSACLPLHGRSSCTCVPVRSQPVRLFLNMPQKHQVFILLLCHLSAVGQWQQSENSGWRTTIWALTKIPHSKSTNRGTEKNLDMAIIKKIKFSLVHSK